MAKIINKDICSKNTLVVFIVWKYLVVSIWIWLEIKCSWCKILTKIAWEWNAFRALYELEGSFGKIILYRPHFLLTLTVNDTLQNIKEYLYAINFFFIVFVESTIEHCNDKTNQISDMLFDEVTGIWWICYYLIYEDGQKLIRWEHGLVGFDLKQVLKVRLFLTLVETPWKIIWSFEVI